MRAIAQDFLMEVIRSLLKPVVRLCIRHSVQLVEVLEALKSVFVEVAKEELKRQGEMVSLSRLSVMTGVHRKDVTRLEKGRGETKPKENLIARIMVQWQHNKKFLTKDGKPKLLEAEGRNSEFAKLVDSVTGGDLGSYPVQFEMERLGVVERNGTKLKLCWRDFVAKDDVKTGLSMLSEDINDLSVAVEQNLFEDKKEKNLHLKTIFDNISVDALPEIKKWLLNEGSLFHRKVREYLSAFDADTSTKKFDKAGARVAFGSFSFCEERI